MTRLTKNISRHELRCKCGACQYMTIDYLTINMAQDACTHFEKVLGVDKVILNIHSAHRCPTHNKNVGGAKSSKHMLGMALDISIVGVPNEVLFDYFVNKYKGKFGIGLYKTFVHIDSREGCARW